MEEEEEEDAEQDEVEGNEGNKPGISHLILTRLEMLMLRTRGRSHVAFSSLVDQGNNTRLTKRGKDTALAP